MTYKVLIESIKENKEQFEEIHGAADFYGGSTAADICGLGWNSPLDVWMLKTGKKEPVKTTPQMLLGSLSEHVIEYMIPEVRPGWSVKMVDQVWQDSDRPWMIASPDATITPMTISGGDHSNTKLAEFKTHKIYADRDWQDGRISDSAHCQLMWYLGISDYEQGVVCALIGGDTDKFYTPELVFCPDTFKALVARVEEFRDFVKRDIPPCAGPGDADAIKELLVGPQPETADLSESHAEQLAEYFLLMAQKDALKGTWNMIEKNIKAIKNDLILASGGACNVKIGDSAAKISISDIPERMSKGYRRVTCNIKRG